jgi:hypothetical protein
MHAICRLHHYLKLMLVASTLVMASAAHAQRTITVTHPEVSKPTLIDLGTPGESVGDQRLWHFKAVTSDGIAVRTDWIMTTTGINTADKGVESRITTGVFTFGDGTDNQILLQGVAFYPGEGATLKLSSRTLRAVVGGTGKYAGARGWVESLHRPDGTWAHIFHLK